MNTRSPQSTTDVNARPKKPHKPRTALPGIKRIDGRSKEARSIGREKARLIAEIGTPTVQQAILIDRAAVLALHIALADARLGDLCLQERRDYLRQTGEYRALITTLLSPSGKAVGRPPKPAAPTLAAETGNAVLDFLASRKAHV